MLAAIIYEITLARISSFSHLFPNLNQIGLLAFFILFLIYSLGQYVVLRWTKQTIISEKMKNSLNIKTLKYVRLIQWILILIFSLTMTQILFTNSYSNILVLVAVCISYSFAAMMMSYLAWKLFRWYADNRNPIVLAYFVAISVVVFNIVVTTIFTSQIILSQHMVVKENIADYTPLLPKTTSTIYLYSGIITFACMWVAAGVLLMNLTRLSKIKYWSLMAIPLVYYLAQFQPYLNNFLFGYFISDPVGFAKNYTIIFTAIEPIGGFLFGLAFWVTAKKLESGKIKSYLFIAGAGLLLFFASNHAAVLVNYAFPPFGLLQVGYLSLSSYLILTGIHSSAISVAQDDKLRQTIRKSIAQQKANFIERIGTSEMTDMIYKRTFELTKKLEDSMVKESQVSPSLTTEQVMDYIDEVMKEKGMIDGQQ